MEKVKHIVISGDAEKWGKELGEILRSWGHDVQMGPRDGLSLLETLEQLADTVTATALCGLGKTAANPVKSTIQFFRDEYIEHIVEKKCRTKNCQALKTIYIEKDLCKGCSLCSRVCPVDAISGKVKEPFEIDPAKCIKCGACMEKCKFNAIKEG